MNLVLKFLSISAGSTKCYSHKSANSVSRNVVVFYNFRQNLNLNAYKNNNKEKSDYGFSLFLHDQKNLLTLWTILVSIFRAFLRNQKKT